MPRVSVLVPAYQAGRTFRRSLAALKGQSYRDFELIVIETGAPCGIADWLETHWPETRYFYFKQPKFPHEALNIGLEKSWGELCAFTDIDAYPASDWLQQLVRVYDQIHQPVVGGVACYGRGWLDRGAHFIKFDKWLAGLAPRWLQEGPTVNFLVSKTVLQQLGGFRTDTMHADTDLSWRLRDAGFRLRLNTAAVVQHHHLHSWSSLLLERFQRGASFANFYQSSYSLGAGKTLAKLLVSVIPLRLVSQLFRVGTHAKSAGKFREYVLTLPVICSGLHAWLLGESFTYLRQVMRLD